MSDEEEVMSEEETEEAPPAEEEAQSEPEEEDEEEKEEEAPPPRKVSIAPVEDSGPTEAELAMQKRRANLTISSAGLDETAKELLEQNAMEREGMSQEIQELRERSERRKQERIEEERELQLRRQEEDVRRKQEEEDRKKAKEDQERERREKRDQQMKEFAKFSDTGKPNFVVIKKSSELVGNKGEEEKEEGEGKMSREQMEQERKAILSQRILPLEIEGFDAGKLTDKAKSLHREILRLEGEKYDLEKRFKEQQYDMLEMAERARQINKVGKTGLKRVVLKDEERDAIQERYSGAPSKIELYSRFERQPDKRKYGEKYTVFTGPTYLFPAEKIAPARIVKWDENTGLPIYEDMPGVVRAAEAEGEE